MVSFCLVKCCSCHRASHRICIFRKKSVYHRNIETERRKIAFYLLICLLLSSSSLNFVAAPSGHRGSSWAKTFSHLDRRDWKTCRFVIKLSFSLSALAFDLKSGCWKCTVVTRVVYMRSNCFRKRHTSISLGSESGSLSRASASSRQTRPENDKNK